MSLAARTILHGVVANSMQFIRKTIVKSKKIFLAFYIVQVT